MRVCGPSPQHFPNVALHTKVCPPSALVSLFSYMRHCYCIQVSCWLATFYLRDTTYFMIGVLNLNVVVFFLENEC